MPALGHRKVDQKHPGGRAANGGGFPTKSSPTDRSTNDPVAAESRCRSSDSAMVLIFRSPGLGYSDPVQRPTPYPPRTANGRGATIEVVFKIVMW